MQFTENISSILNSSRSTFIGPVASTGHSETGKSTGNKQTSVSPSDRVTISPEGSQISVEKQSLDQSQGENDIAPGNTALSVEELTQTRKLEARDQEVRAHEQAHLSAAGQYAASGASFTYQQGPDGKRYAVGGEVQIDISKEDSPEATLQKMEVISRAAMAPSSPSAADRQIAAQAAVMAAQARQEIAAQERSGEADSTSTASGNEESQTAQPGEDNDSTQNNGALPPAEISLALNRYEQVQALG